MWRQMDIWEEGEITFWDFWASIRRLITMPPLFPLLLPDTRPYSWQQQTKRADFTGLRRGGQPLWSEPVKKKWIEGEVRTRQSLEEGKVT